MCSPAFPIRWILLFLALAFATLATRTAHAQYPPSNYPSWWSSYGVLSGTTPDDFSVANQGQTKNMAVAADAELDNDIAQFGGAGAAVDQLAATLSGTTPLTNDFLAISLGQLKAIAQPFYDQLLSIGYKAGPLSSGTYPWVASGLAANDFEVANIGQLKYLFSFNVTYSSAGNGIPDWWVQKYFPGSTVDGTTGLDPAGTVPGDSGETYLQAFQSGSNPIFYAGQSLNVTIASGNNQTSSPGAFLPAPLVALVTDTNNNPVTGAPVTFSVTGSGQFQANADAAPASTGTVNTGATGQALMYFQLPATLSATSQIPVTAGTGSAIGEATFYAYSDSGTGSYVQPFAPSNVVGSMNDDGSETVTWQDNDPDSPIYIYLQSGGTWTVSGTLAAGTTSYTIQASQVGYVEIGNNDTPGGSTGSTGGSGSGGGPGPGPGPGPGLDPFTPVPIGNCVMIDVSTGVVSPGAEFESVALGDNDQLAYATYSNGTVYTYLWSAGTTTHLMATPDQRQVPALVLSATGGGIVSGTATEAFFAPVITTSGQLYGDCGTLSGLDWADPEQPFVLGVQPCIASGTSFTPSNPDIQMLYPDDSNPYLSSGNEMIAYYSYLIDAKGGATCVMSEPDYQEAVDVSGSDAVVPDPGTEMFQINGGSGGEHLFLNQNPIWCALVGGTTSTPPPNMILTGFQPDEINSSGWAIGADSDLTIDGTFNGALGTYDLWDGTSLHALPGPPVDINDQGYVVGTGSNGSEGYVYSEGGTWSILGLLPTEYQSQITSIAPIAISNGESNYSIVFTALGETGSGSWSGPNYYLLTGAGANPQLQQVVLPPNSSFNWGSRCVNSQGLIGGLGSSGGIDPSGPAPTVTLALTRSDGGGWQEAGSTDANPGILWSRPFSMKATAKMILGESGTVNILQDGTASMRVTYTDNSTTSCQTPGMEADYSDISLANPATYGTDAQGNIWCKWQDQPAMRISTGVRNYISQLVYSGSFRDFVVVGYGTATPKVVAEITWSFSESATFTPDPNAPSGTGETKYKHDYKCTTIPAALGTTYGGPPIDSPVEPRDQSGNDYMGKSKYWTQVGGGLAHDHPFPLVP